MNIPFLQDTSFTGLISTGNYGTSQDWNDAYTILQANSADWVPPGPGRLWGTIIGVLSAQTDLWAELSAKALSSDIVPTIVSFLSSNLVTVESLNANSQILSGGVDLSDIFITSAEESQTLSYDPLTYDLSISLGNEVNLSSIVISPNANAIFQSLSTQTVTTTDVNVLNSINVSGSLDVGTEILSANIPLHDIFLTAETESQTLFYDVTGEELSISGGNAVGLSALGYRNFNISLSAVETIQEFAQQYAEIITGDIHPGYTVKLYNGRIYAFAGTNKSNPNHYLEVNTNPYKLIYREIPLNSNEYVIDSFFLGEFKTAKYILQIETNFNNEIYYSEINVVGSVAGGLPSGAASEYGQISTSQLIQNYDVNIDNANNLQLIVYFNSDPNPFRKYIVKGHRTNFYKI
jgi:hypothetical protein